MSRKSTYYLMGFGCGSLAGLLFAPKSGSAIRAGIARAGKRRERLIKKQVSSAAAAIENYRAGALRALKRALPSNRVRALFQ
jgi:gas vesicle protein